MSAASISMSDAMEDAEAMTIMYTGRMKYLHEDSSVKPEVLFMTRKQAQKDSQRSNSGVESLRKLEGAPSPPRRPNGITSPRSGRKQRLARETTRRLSTWVECFQAGCHFYQNTATGECRAEPPVHISPKQDTRQTQDSEGDEEVPFPPSFSFLEPP